MHGSNKGSNFANVVNNEDENRGNAGDNDDKASGGRPSRGGATKTRRFYYCKK